MLEEKSHTSSLLCVAERIFQVRNDRVTQKRRRRWVHPVHSGIYVYTVVVGAVARVNERRRKLTLYIGRILGKIDQYLTIMEPCYNVKFH